jgi:hypothetical protein
LSKQSSPQQRAIARKRALWHELRETNKRIPDPDSYKFEKLGNHFDKLSDAEWSPVWQSVSRAVGTGSKLNEMRIRERVDDAAYSSGWFVGFGGEFQMYSSHWLARAEECRRILGKCAAFREQLLDFFGDPPGYDPWDFFRPIISALAELEQVLEAEISTYQDAKHVKSPPNAVKTELDAWRTRLILIWRDECGLPAKNNKALRNFLVTCLEPYTIQNDKMAKDFIAKWRAGKVPKLGLSLLELNSDE